MARRDEYISPLGKIILARAKVIGANRGQGIPPRDLTLAEMSALTDGQLTRAAINDWIVGRVKNPTPRLLNSLARALADPPNGPYPHLALLNDMRAAVGMPSDAATRTVDVADLSDADIEVVQLVATRLRNKGQEAAHQALHATDRATRFVPDDGVDDDRDSLAASH